MQAALAAHDGVLRAAIDAHGGWMFKHTGDGVCAAFSSPRAAVDAAVEAQRSLALPVRMGVATGEAELREGDYFGPALNRAARVMAAGHGGQILLVSSTASLISGIGLIDLGSRHLKDLAAPVQVFQVLADGLRSEFPPLRTLDATLGNLRTQPTSFVGRTREVADVIEAVRAHRLVTLTGAGGVGKTRLSLEVAGELESDLGEGAWLCELAAAANADEMAQVVALTLGVAPRAQMTLIESIVDFLRTRDLQVLLDNCEHLVDETAELVAAILAGAPNVRVLATSQEALAIPGEHLWPLRSLPVAADGSGDAVALFIERAQAVDPGFRLDAVSTSAVVEVCLRLDGVPLAIELAAARTAMMSPAEIAGHLDERFRLLTGGRRGRVKRHHTLQAAIEWSYSLLRESERVVFDALGVFPGSFDESAVVAVCAGDGLARWDVIDALASLVAKSMVDADRSESATRYHLLETLRHFARDRSASRSEDLRRRHGAHYASFAEEAGSALRSPDELLWRRRLGLELDNLRTAAAWGFDALDLDDVDLAVRLVANLLYEVQVRMSWGIQGWASSALPRVDELSPIQQSVVLGATAFAAYLGGRLDEAIQLAERALGVAEAPDGAVLLAVSALSFPLAVRGDPAMALRVLVDARRRLSVSGADDCCLSAVHIITAWFAYGLGNFDLAKSEAEEGVRAARRSGVTTVMMAALGSGARVLSEDDPDTALALAEEVLALADGFEASDSASLNLQTVTLLSAARGDLTRAARALVDAVRNHARDGNRLYIAGDLALAVLVLAGVPGRADSAAVIAGAKNGPVLGHMPAFLGGGHDQRYLLAVERVVAMLETEACARAQQRGAAMMFDEIVDFVLTELGGVGPPGTPIENR